MIAVPLIPLILSWLTVLVIGLLFGRLLERDAQRRLGAPMPLPLAIARVQRKQQLDLDRELAKAAIRRRV